MHLYTPTYTHKIELFEHHFLLNCSFVVLCLFFFVLASANLTGLAIFALRLAHMGERLGRVEERLDGGGGITLGI